MNSLGFSFSPTAGQKSAKTHRPHRPILNSRKTECALALRISKVHPPPQRLTRGERQGLHRSYSVMTSLNLSRALIPSGSFEKLQCNASRCKCLHFKPSASHETASGHLRMGLKRLQSPRIPATTVFSSTDCGSYVFSLMREQQACLPIQSITVR